MHPAAGGRWTLFVAGVVIDALIDQGLAAVACPGLYPT